MLAVFAKGGTYLKISNNNKDSRTMVKDKTKDGPKRGPVFGRSAKSKKNLCDKLHQIPKDNPPLLFVTPTFSDDAIDLALAEAEAEGLQPWQVYHRQVRALESWVRYHYGDHISIVTDWEWVRRKSGKYKGQFIPHPHMLLWGVERISIEKLRPAWFQVVGAESRVNIKKVNNIKGMYRYLLKHHVKGSESVDIPTGRTWGITGAKYLGIKLIPVVLTIFAFHKIRRSMRRLISGLRGHRCEWGKVRGQGLTAYVSEQTARRLLSWCAE